MEFKKGVVQVNIRNLVILYIFLSLLTGCATQSAKRSYLYLEDSMLRQHQNDLDALFNAWLPPHSNSGQWAFNTWLDSQNAHIAFYEGLSRYCDSVAGKFNRIKSGGAYPTWTMECFDGNGELLGSMVSQPTGTIGNQAYLTYSISTTNSKAKEQACWVSKGFSINESKEWCGVDGYFTPCTCIPTPYYKKEIGDHHNFVDIVALPFTKVGISPAEAKRWKGIKIAASNFGTYLDSGSVVSKSIPIFLKELGFTPETAARLSYQTKGGGLFSSVEEVAVMTLNASNNDSESMRQAKAYMNKVENKRAKTKAKKEQKTINELAALNKAMSEFHRNAGEYGIGYKVCNAKNEIGFVEEISNKKVKILLKGLNPTVKKESLKPYELGASYITDFKYTKVSEIVWQNKSDWSACETIDF